ncbi:MAG: leucine-rich repeat domain-containing protein [Roseburia sp.]|nr:leucine-rich repeat domain-containing protein [Roseburia sp.]
MKRKILVLLIIAVAAFACGLGLFACGDSENDNTDGSEHIHNYQWVDNGDGTHKQHCSVSGCAEPDKYTESHEYGVYMYNNDAKCIQDGTESATCIICTHVDTRTKAGTATGIHTYGTYTYNNNATCVADGTESATCINCTHVDTRTKFHTATGIHTYGTYTYNDDATCVADGTESATCINCPHADTRTKAGTATGIHTYGTYTYNNDATCTVDGTESATCINCPHVDTRTKANTANHNYVDWICTECGSKTLEFNSITENNVSGYSVSKGAMGNDTNIVIPETYLNKPVLEIPENAFSGCGNLTSIEIPNSVTSIGSGAFSGCNQLIQTENGVQYVDKWAIGCDDSVSSVVLRANTVGIADKAFFGRSDITSIEIPSSVMSIGSGVFAGCSSASMTVQNGNTNYCIKGNCLIETESKTLIYGCKNSVIPIDGSVTSIEDYAFYCCGNLTSIEIPNTVTRIGGYAFVDCSNLTSMEIPSSVTSIGENAFVGCSQLIQTEDGVQYVDKWAIGCSDYSSVTSVNLRPDTVGIGYAAFVNCVNLTSIEIPNSVTRIECHAFNGCSSLTNIEIPSSVTSIGERAFHGCSSLTIYCEAASKPSGWDNRWNDSDLPVEWGCTFES